MIRDLAPNTPIHEEAWDTLSLRDYIKRLYHCHDDNCLHDEHLFMSHTFKDLRTLSLVQWKTILEGVPDTVLRAKVLYQLQKDLTNFSMAHITVPLHLLESTDYGLVVIGRDFNVPMVHNEVCQS